MLVYFFKLALVWCFLFHLHACKSSGQQPSETKHDLGWSESKLPLFFHDFPLETAMPIFIEQIYPSEQNAVQGGILGPDDPRVKRAKYWIDFLWKKIINMYPEYMEGIPKPELIVWNDDSTNAMVVHIIGRLDVPVVGNLPAAESEELDSTNRYLIQFGDHIFETAASSNHPPLPYSDDFFERYDRMHRKSKCRILKSNEGMLTVSQDCNGTLRGDFKGLLFPFVPHHIHLMEGMFKVSREKFLITTLLHEFAHYIRQHGVFLKTEGQYYIIGDPAPLEVQHEALKEFGDHIREQSRAAKSFWNFYHLTGLVTDYSSLQSVIDAVRSKDEAPCLEAQELIAAEKLDYYYKSTPSLKDQFDLIGDALQPQYRRLFELYGQCTGKAVDFSGPLAEYQGIVRDLSEARARKLGFYTMEQEADEIALEMGMHLGLTVDDFMGKYLEILELRGLGDSKVRKNALGLGHGACRELLSRNGLDHDGNPIFIGIGDYEDLHHDLCFRAFNMLLETQAHDYHPADTEIPSTVHGVSWETFLLQQSDVVE